VHPTILEATVVIPGEGCGICGRQPASQNPQPHQNLETIADPQHQPILLAKVFDQVTQMTSQAAGHDPSRGNIVSVGKTTRDAEDLVSMPQLRIFDQTIDMDAFRNTSSGVKSMSCFLITISSGGAEN
jgi:hypothetical protein